MQERHVFFTDSVFLLKIFWMNKTSASKIVMKKRKQENYFRKVIRIVSLAICCFVILSSLKLWKHDNFINIYCQILDHMNKIYVKELSRGETCVANFIPPVNGASLGSSIFEISTWSHVKELRYWALLKLLILARPWPSWPCGQMSKIVYIW